MENTLIGRCANQAARAIIKEIEAVTKQDLPWADCAAIIEHVGAALSSDTFNANFPQHLRNLLSSGIHDRAGGVPEGKLVVRDDSTRRMARLRWLVVTLVKEQWDDRAKEYSTDRNKYPPTLQYLDGEAWVDVPTVELPRERLNTQLRNAGGGEASQAL